MLYLVLSIIIAILVGVVYFLLNEMSKKSKMFKSFVLKNDNYVYYHYHGACHENIKRGYYTTVITANKEFKLVMCILLGMNKLGPYGYAKSEKINGEHVVKFTHYFGRGPGEFLAVFDINIKDSGVKHLWTQPGDPKCKNISKAHWWQRI